MYNVMYNEREKYITDPFMQCTQFVTSSNTVVVVILIGFAGGPGIFCSYPDFLRTVLSSPTAYCTISGDTTTVYGSCTDYISLTVLLTVLLLLLLTILLYRIQYMCSRNNSIPRYKTVFEEP